MKNKIETIKIKPEEKIIEYKNDIILINNEFKLFNKDNEELKNELNKFLNNKSNILDKDYSIIIPDNSLNNEINFNIDLLKEKNILINYPLVINDNNNIKCNLKSEYKIGPISPIHYIAPINFKIISFVNEDLKIDIEKGINEENITFTNISLKTTKVNYGEFIELLIDFQKNKIIESQDIKYNFNLILSTKEVETKISLCINLILVPFQVNFYCSNNLIENENYFELKDDL
jgi:hypothetical protein